MDLHTSVIGNWSMLHLSWEMNLHVSWEMVPHLSQNMGPHVCHGKNMYYICHGKDELRSFMVIRILDRSWQKEF